MNRFRRIAVVVNPTAQNGKAADAGRQVERFLTRAIGSDAFTVFHTSRPRQATEIVAQLNPAYGTVITVGGDGLVHEVANGLMRINAVDRPQLAVVPLGSGNDYAETLGMTRARNVEDALSRIFDYHVEPMDVGCVNGEYFVETLSFGVDAAIALDTVERRRRTGRTGTLLYLESGIDQILHHLDDLRYEAHLTGVPWSFDGGGGGALDVHIADADVDSNAGASDAGGGLEAAGQAKNFPCVSGASGVSCAAGASGVSRSAAPFSRELHLEGSSYLFAVQIGPTYGGHFKICPNASPSDGLFDICLAHPPLNALSASALFLSAKGGHHVGSKHIEFHKAQGLNVRFDTEPSVQVDGEKLHGTTFHISIEPQAIRVLCGSKLG